MYSRLFSSILNKELRPNIQLVIQRFIELQARTKYTAGYNFKLKLGLNVKLVIQQFIEIQARNQCTAGYSAVY